MKEQTGVILYLRNRECFACITWSTLVATGVGGHITSVVGLAGNQENAENLKKE